MVTAQELKKIARRQKRNLTPSEAAFKAKLDAAGIVYINHPIIGFFIPDFVVPSRCLAIEIDGGYHQEEHQARYDRRRDHFLEESGLLILRIVNECVDRWRVADLDRFPIKNESAFRSILGMANALKGRDIEHKRRREPRG